ncbi:MAG: (2Fe-2S) ferredoxin domain-containing protein [Planctomycetota bacterium]
MNRPYKKLVLVCTHGRSCPHQGAVETCEALREAVHQADLNDQIRIIKSGCLAQCGHGPMVAIEPDGDWYGSVTAQDVEEFVTGPLISGVPLARLLYQPKNQGKNVIPRDQWPIPPSEQNS